jgi:hypothetical protein
MRYLLQAITMLSDIMVLVSIWFVATSLGLLGLILAVLAICKWLKDDEWEIFFAWRPKNIRTFLKNAKKMGL